ncbi:hypothetical protein cyc_01745 [Cyclospora cayetanensis]|nr:hypothetical protein cyc_01745 [Cyclospora cayetanensis]
MEGETCDSSACGSPVPSFAAELPVAYVSAEADCGDNLATASTVDLPMYTKLPEPLQGAPSSVHTKPEPPSQHAAQLDSSVLGTAYPWELYAEYAKQLATWSSRTDTKTNQEEELLTLCDSKRELVREWLKRPARRQVLSTDIENTCHVEGQNEYNIWYGRHLTDRYNHPSHLDREAALYRCDPELDAGYTAADLHPGSSEGYICAFFAKGCCTRGSECRYKHRIPTLEDEYTLEWSRDIFGRERHKDHRDDMGGAGSFNHECKTLFVGGLQVDPLEEDGIQSLERFLWEAFGVWGDLKEVRVIPKKLIGFVTYAYRVQAEFAKVAMADQNFGKYGTLLSVKWAHQDGNAKRKNESEEKGKRQKSAKVGGLLQGQTTGQGKEETVRKALESYCSAWKAYWAAVCAGGNPADDTLANQQGPLSLSSMGFPQLFSNHMLEGHHNLPGFGSSTSQWHTEEKSIGDEESQRLLSVLNRVEGLSSSDFLRAGVIGPCE